MHNYHRNKDKRATESREEETTNSPKKVMDNLKELGMPFIAWWTGVWAATGVGIYGGMEYGGLGILSMLQTIPLNGMVALSAIDPKAGNLMVAIGVNELIEPIRFPFVLLTAKPIIYIGGKLWGDEINNVNVNK